MSREEHFVYTKSTVDIKRSKFIANSKWTGDIYHGDLVPLEILEILPGDSFKYDVAAFIRTATPPIAPLMSKIQFSIAAFYVPKRLVFAKTKEFYGEATEGYGIQSEVLEPRTTGENSVQAKSSVLLNPHAIGKYLGLVRQNDNVSNPSPISLNPIRAFLQVYNDWFRNENFHAPYLWDHSQTGDAARAYGTLNGSNYFAFSPLPKVCKMLDKWTSSLPWAQKGSPVLLPLGETAPIINSDTMHYMGDDTLKFGAAILGPNGELTGNLQVYENEVQAKGDGITTGPLAINKTNMVADLSSATAASVNELRLAFATQRYLEALARTGSKYREYIKGMFGVSIGDKTAQMAEYLGGMTIDLNIDQVLQTTDYSAGASTKLGAPGASSTSAAVDHLFIKSFDEPGYLVVVGYSKHVRSYGQGISEIYQKHELFDYYNPKFANIGEIAMKENGIYFDGDSSKDNVRFGFQEAWQEYKHIPDRIVGALNPSITNSYNFWSLGENFASAPTLNGDFLKEDRSNIVRCLAGGENSPDYFVDIKFNRTMVRPLPLYDIPGLIDHH